MRPNLGYYVKKINDIVQETEVIGEKMNPHFEKVRNALDNNQAKELSTEELTEIYTNFSTGTAEYHQLLAEVATLRPPAKLMGIHKKFEKAFQDYVAGCDDMREAVNPENQSVNRLSFDLSEKKQDEATDIMSVCIQKMTRTLQ